MNSLPTLPPDTQLVLAIMSAVACAPEDNEQVQELFNEKLGRGWSKEFLACRSYTERLAVLRRRCSFVDSYGLHDGLRGQTAFEDGGAR